MPKFEKYDLAEQAPAEPEVAPAEAAAPEPEAAAAEVETPPSRSRRCPLCRGELIAHGDANPHKAGCYHCNACGCCWAPDLKGPREGTSLPKAPDPVAVRS